MKKLILHIGFSKTGSSTLQAFLCRQSLLNGASGRYQYFVARNGRLSTGRRLALRAAFHPLSYVGTDIISATAVRVLSEKMPLSDYTPILSHESWGHKYELLPDLSVALQEGSFETEVIAFVRPQIDWFQSAWWQWFAWGADKPHPEKVWDQMIHFENCNWVGHLERYAALENVASVKVRLFNPEKDIVSTFLQTLKLDELSSLNRRIFRSNRSLSPIHINLYNQLPGLRQPHRGVLDGVVTRLLPFREKAPGIISRNLARRIIEDMKPCNEKLLDWLAPEERKIMKADLRWWDDKAYVDDDLRI